MRKRNGLTIVELMIALILISIVMIFIFNLLIDLRQEETLSTYKTTDQLNRSIITKTIQDDFLDRGIKTISSCKTSDSSSGEIACIRFNYADGSLGTVRLEDKYISYENPGIDEGDEKMEERWKLNSATYSKDYFYCYEEKGDYFFLQFVFPVNMNNNLLQSKMVFDIELLYMGELSESGSGIPKDGTSLGAKVCSTLT